MSAPEQAGRSAGGWTAALILLSVKPPLGSLGLATQFRTVSIRDSVAPAALCSWRAGRLMLHL